MTTSISLRTYNREIESLIEGNQIEEAIANCRHILERYPKHVATYRLLGKAYLEVQRYTDAEDVLQRVLSCIPDDFIAHLGLSIIREEAGDLETAIWHMERAFDVQPSNAAIQAELRRLYGRRDGTPPVKVTLTRGALARMSARSHLYSQAISELRAILAEDPQRPDLQVVLARLYFQTGQRNASVEICSSLLNRLPNCLEANRILAEVLPSTERASEAPYYKQRVEAIDPYNAYISPDYPSVEQVPDESVMLDRLVIGLTTELRPPKLVDLETSAAAGEVIQESTPENEQAGNLSTSEEEIPDWMRTAGWVAASEATQEKEAETSPFVEETPEENEIPEWLRTLAPEEQPVGPEESAPTEEQHGESEESARPEEAALPGWLSSPAAVAAGLGTAAVLSGEEGEAETEEQPAEESFPARSEEVPVESVEVEDQQAEPESLPGWLAESQVESGLSAAEESPEAASELPEWLAGTQTDAETGAAALGAAAVVSQEQEAGGLAEEGLGEESGTQVLESASSSPEEASSPAGWVVESQLESAAEEHLPGEEIIDTAESEAGETGEVLEEGSGPGQPQGVTEDEIPAWLQELSPSETGPIPAEEPEVAAVEVEPEPPEAADAASLAFLAALAPEEARDEQTEEVTLPATPAIDTTPDWLKELAGEAELSPSLEAPEAGAELVTGETVPDWLRAISEGAAGDTAAGEAWQVESDSLLGKEELAPAEDTSTGVPDWLQAAMATGAVEAAGEVLSDEPAENQLAEPTVIEGDTRPVRLDSPPVEVPIEATPEAILPDEEVAFKAEDQESTSAWLESQGADTETAVGEAEIIEEISIEETVSEEGFALEPIEETQEDDTPDWLGIGVAAAIGAGLEEQVDQSKAAEEASLDEAAEPPGTTSSLAEILAAAGAVYEADQLLEEDQPVAELDEEPETGIFEEQPAAIPSPEYDWEEESQAAVEEAETPDDISAAGETVSADLPDWLREYEKVEPASPADMEETEWFSTAAATSLLDEAKLPPREPAGMLDLNAASQSQLERLPGVGFILAQNIVSYRERYGPFSSLDQLAQVPGITPEIALELSQRLTLTIVPESQPPASEIPELAQAWQRLSAGDIPGAVAYYDRMIQQEQDLDEVIKEIQQALALYPGDPSLYQALGDSLMRADRLQEALEAYDRAEDLIR